MKIFNQMTKIIYSSLPFVILSLPVFILLSGFQLRVENTVIYLIALILVVPLMMVLMNLYYSKHMNPSNLFNQYFLILKANYFNYLKFALPFILIIGYFSIVMAISFKLKGINLFGCMLVPLILLAIGWFLFMMIARVSFDKQISNQNIILLGSKYWLGNIAIVLKSISWSLIGFLVVMLFGPIFEGFAIAIILFVISKRISRVNFLMTVKVMNDYKKVR
ncbi:MULTISPECIES: hypothetical protein [unclassified Enterococcus]|uniref:hypothetical protein n=1 Tax=unclassified Enterococcus TaxID=2608891 RepID=UPI00155492B6|nr:MULTISPECIES: hypothetical protein [unclassified Enterococcus]MBS7578156.1 hypothetical protein [Enterococcus sp. MMGLQ5-2]MBS7584028.1 hypothetical protein [Enterococcus sp. MMGLQ5-1]NPD11889.1 hypothetical protein [Enterococcus sp. MMGLQ5-1]NPD37987.1 hypothetical protein [Enterococcus sp. MMGLQ5-2]